ncbi:MAG: TonB-dependent outer membrane protein SusC/RagA, conserved site [Gemmatimonadales bacterium]|jgi:TonB-dependent SusC/RagA subfamily outer membrane receptor|nr:TonB-dependent outer membrane protein SusC/RagA, conserved site [Gemmatimonadales bacterium]
MVSLTPRVSLFGVLLVGLTVGCIGNTRPPVNDMPDPSPTRALAGTTVTSDDLDQNPTQSIERALQGHVAGVIITQNGEGGISVRIRGQTTINGNTEPLFVIDGLPIQAGPGGALVGINPHDIASIEVLKDAASLAFYGVRGANGVILIKTKHSN